MVRRLRSIHRRHWSKRGAGPQTLGCSTGKPWVNPSTSSSTAPAAARGKGLASARFISPMTNRERAGGFCQSGSIVSNGAGGSNGLQRGCKRAVFFLVRQLPSQEGVFEIGQHRI